MERRSDFGNIRKVESTGISSLTMSSHRPGSGQGSGDMKILCHRLQSWGKVKGNSRVSVAAVCQWQPRSWYLPWLYKAPLPPNTLPSSARNLFNKCITCGAYSVSAPHVVQCGPALPHLVVVADTMPLRRPWEDGVSVRGLGFRQEEKADKI